MTVAVSLAIATPPALAVAGTTTSAPSIVHSFDAPSALLRRTTERGSGARPKVTPEVAAALVSWRFRGPRFKVGLRHGHSGWRIAGRTTKRSLRVTPLDARGIYRVRVARKAHGSWRWLGRASAPFRPLPGPDRPDAGRSPGRVDTAVPAPTPEPSGVMPGPSESAPASSTPTPVPPSAPTSTPTPTPTPNPEARIEGLLSQLTLDERVQLLYGTGRPLGVHSVGYVPGVPRLGIPALKLADGPVGVNDSCWMEVEPANCHLGQATALPATASLAATFDRALAEDYGRLLGAETRARDVDVLYGPAINIVRVPQGGRNFEYFSEDPLLTGELATAWTDGLQSQGVAAQAKHYALNNQERDRHTTSSDADERTIREIYLPAWEQVTRSSASIMCANNMVNGSYSCENAPLLARILEGEWAWPGAVGSDYNATRSAIPAVSAGLDQSFHARDWGKWYRDLPELVRSGQLSQAVIDERVRRVLRMMLRIGALDPGRPQGLVDVAAGRELAQRVAERGSVLLKNNGSLLPLDPGGIGRVAVIGPRATTAVIGGGGSSEVKPYASVSPYEGIRDRLGGAGEVVTADGADLTAAADLARGADVAIVVANDVASEGDDRAGIGLPGGQDELIAAVTAANPRTVVALQTGSAVTMPWLADVPAVLAMWYPGQENGRALAAMLFGDTEPAGRLPVSFPRSIDEHCCTTAPRYPAVDGHYDYSEKLEVGYRWFDANDVEPLFPFGYGLSYTTFELSDLSVTPDAAAPGTDVVVRVKVRNTGGRAGRAVPQVYLGFPDTAGEPPRRLVGFESVALAPGESRTVAVSVPARSFMIWDTDAHAWDASPGSYTIFAGTSSRDLPLSAGFTMQQATGVQGIRVEAPAAVPAGGTVDVPVALTNSGAVAVLSPAFSLSVPSGWSAVRVGSAPGSVPAGGSATATFRISAPDGSGPGSYTVTGRVHATGQVPVDLARAVTLRVD